MALFDYTTGVKFKKTGREIKTAIQQRIAELRKRLAKRDRELERVMENKALLRSYLVRKAMNDYPHSAQLKAEMPTEEHQRITELCRRIHVIEREIAELSIVHDNLKDNQELELSFEDVTRLGFSPEHYRKNVG
jgi:hypothetical protein